MKTTITTILIWLALCASAAAQNSAWEYSTQTDISGKVTEFATSSSLVIRCSSKCEVLFTPNRYELVEDQGSVLVKFNGKDVKRYNVTRSQDDTALFFSDPVTILRAIRDNGGYMTIQYKPYEKTPDTVQYGVWYLPPTILLRIAAALKVKAAQEKSDLAVKAAQEKSDLAAKKEWEAGEPARKSAAAEAAAKEAREQIGRAAAEAAHCAKLNDKTREILANSDAIEGYERYNKQNCGIEF